MAQAFSSNGNNSFPISLMGDLTLKVYSAGALQGNAASITLNNQDIGIENYHRGLNVAIIDSTIGKPLYCTYFDTHVPGNTPAFVNFIETLPDGVIVAIAVKEEASQHFTETAQQVCQLIGSSSAHSLSFQSSYGIIGFKGKEIAAKSEKIAQNSPVTCEITFTPSLIQTEAYPMLEIVSGGRYHGNTAQMRLNGEIISFPNGYQNGLNVIIFDELTGNLLDTHSFDFSSNPASADAFAELIEDLPQGRGVAIAVQGDGKVNLSPRAEDAFHALGSQLIEQLAINASYGMVGYKGMNRGKAIENLSNTPSEYSTDPLSLKVWLSPFFSSSPFWQPPHKLYLPDYKSYDYFGSAIAIKGNYALIAAHLSDTADDYNIGAIYVLQWEQGYWQQFQSLQPMQLHRQAVFGKAVAINDNYSMIGAYLSKNLQNIATGAVYLYQHQPEQWELTQILYPQNVETEACFGAAIALEESWAAIGAYNGYNAQGKPTGTVDLYRLEGEYWQFEQRLQPPNGDSGDGFGYALAMSGNLLAVGAYRANTPDGVSGGAVYLFQQQGNDWQLIETLQPSDLSIGDGFGASIALENDVLLIGAPYQSTGVVYVYHHLVRKWQPVQKWQPKDLREGEKFGNSLDISGKLAIVGAQYGSSPNYPRSGATYTFERDSDRWKPKLKLYGSDCQSGDHFGYAVAIDGNRVLVGTPKATIFGEKDAGSVYPGQL